MAWVSSPPSPPNRARRPVARIGEVAPDRRDVAEHAPQTGWTPSARSLGAHRVCGHSRVTDSCTLRCVRVRRARVKRLCGYSATTGTLSPRSRQLAGEDRGHRGFGVRRDGRVVAVPGRLAARARRGSGRARRRSRRGRRAGRSSGNSSITIMTTRCGWRTVIAAARRFGVEHDRRRRGGEQQEERRNSTGAIDEEPEPEPDPGRPLDTMTDDRGCGNDADRDAPPAGRDRSSRLVASVTMIPTPTRRSPAWSQRARHSGPGETDDEFERASRSNGGTSTTTRPREEHPRVVASTR